MLTLIEEIFIIIFATTIWCLWVGVKVRCPGCGRRYYHYYRECPDCGLALGQKPPEQAPDGTDEPPAGQNQ